MQSVSKTKLSFIVLACASVFVTAPGYAQRTITLTNSNPPLVIPITAAPVEFSNRVVTVPCAVNAQGACPIGSVAAAPTASFSCLGCASARVGQVVTLSWSSSPTEVCVAGSSGPAATTWTGVQSTSGAGRSLLFSAAGSYSLTLKCFGTSGSTAQQSIAASVSN